MKIENTGVAGIGTMGSGIVVTLSMAGFPVIAFDKSEGALLSGRKNVEAFLSQSVKRGKIPESEKKGFLDLVKWTSDINELSECDAVIEAVYEDMDVKCGFFRELHSIAKPDCIFITNTSTLSVTAIGSGSGRPEKTIGIHFCNPAPLMKLVEIAVTPLISKETADSIYGFVTKLGKEYVQTEDEPGHIVNTLLMPFWADVVRILEEEIATAEDIDTLCRLGFGLPKGPLEMIDIAGLPIMITVLESLYSQNGEKRCRPPHLLRNLAESGFTGRKTGRGFYTYEEKGEFGTTDDGKKEDKIQEVNVSFKKIGVVGFGTMGRGIAQTGAESGFKIIAVEPQSRQRDEGMSFIRKMLKANVEKGRIDKSKMNDILNRIHLFDDFSGLSGCEIVIEAVFEDIRLKKEIFLKIEEFSDENTIIASNTSCIPLTELASALKNPGRACGIHYFNPAPMMKVVEVVKAMQTDDPVIERACSFVKSEGKTPVISKDVPGFISNRLLIPYLFQAFRKYDEGLTSIEDIDKAMELGAGFPMGPFRVSDLIGLDVLLFIGEFMYGETGDSDFAPPSILRGMVSAGYTGRKSGRGFYRYGD